MYSYKLRFWLSITVAALGCFWVGFARLVARSIIEGAYHREGIPWLDNYIVGTGKTLDEFLLCLDSYAQISLLVCLGCVLLFLCLSHPGFFRKYVGEATAESLGIIRVITCGIILVKILWEDLSSLALIPLDATQPMGIIHWFYALPIGFEQFLTSHTSLAIFKYLSALIVFLGMLGWQTRIVLPLGTLCYLLVAGLVRHYSWFWHSGLIPLYLIAVLCFTPCSDSWSVDRLWKVYQDKPVPDADSTSPVYGWSRYACWTVISLGYMFAGFSKIANAGLMWWHPVNTKGILFSSALRKRVLGWGLSLHLTSAPNWLFALMSIPKQFGEITFGLVLFSRTARFILPILMIVMHIGTFFLMEIRFFDLLVLMFIFFDFTAIRKAIALKLRQNFSIQLLYDGECPVCSRHIRLLNCFDLFERLELIDCWSLDLAKDNHYQNLDSLPSELTGKIYVLSSGQVYRGFSGFRMIALALPILWLFVPCLFLPGISSLAKRVYDYLNRRIVFPRTQKLQNHYFSLYYHHKKIDRGLRYSMLISMLIALMAFVWLLRIEFFPFTALQAFSTLDTSGIFTYNKVFIHHESGKISRTHLEDIVGAMTNNRYQALVDHCFKPDSVHICNNFFAKAGSVYNRRLSPQDKAVRFESQLWEWDFKSNPDDPNYGEIIQQHVYHVDGEKEE